MLRNSKRKNIGRRGATTVEFAMVAPILFLTVFACIEFGRVMIVEAFVEQSAFEAARHVAVLGATKQEGIDIVNNKMIALGITSADVTITPLKNGVTQSEIDQATDQVSVVVSAEVGGAFVLTPLVGEGRIERSTVFDTERFKY